MVTLAQPERDLFWQEIDKIRRPEPPIAMEPRKETGWAEPALRVRAKFIRGEEPLRHATVTELLPLQTERKTASSKRKPGKSSEEPPLPNPKLDRSELEDYFGRSLQ